MYNRAFDVPWKQEIRTLNHSNFIPILVDNHVVLPAEADK